MKMSKVFLNNLKKNVRNKTWWISVISLLILILQSRGLNLTKYIGSDWITTINTIFTLLALFGISVNTAPDNEPKQDTSNTNTQLPHTEATTTAINNVVTQNSAQTPQLTQIKLQQIQQILNQ
jgi:uncharacterized membrane protein